MTAASSELADLAWCSVEKLPYDEMPKDYKLWLPHILAGYAVNAFFETDSGPKIFRQKLDTLGRMEEVPIAGGVLICSA